MFVIMVYDVGEERVNKVLKVGRRYLNWVQNSVLEGELTAGEFKQLRKELKEVINLKKDSVIFYTFKTQKSFTRNVMGIHRNILDNII